ncbi:MAG: hypothetical protein LW817_00995 [Candidatus Caenarcaniphilales bacterium]|jgi:hypothetical protein|nr:hypothetical protein [Candidatus Caenarcaniphilales bacterium]
MKSFEEFKFKAEVLKILGFSLLTPLGINLLNMFTTKTNLDDMIWSRIPLSAVIAYVGYRLVIYAILVLKSVDNYLNKEYENDN